MDTMTDSIDSLMRELDELLAAEREAVRGMDSAQIEVLTGEKVKLIERLASQSRQHATPDTIRALSRLRAFALENQLLLVHARDLTRGVVEALSPGRNGGRGALLEVRG